MSEAGGDGGLATEEPIFYFDFSSPFAYLAATRIDEVLPRKPRCAVGEKLFWGDDRLAEVVEASGPSQ